jgi:hypothetical protein
VRVDVQAAAVLDGVARHRPELVDDPAEHA